MLLLQGTVPAAAQPQITPLSRIKADNDGDGQIDQMGDTVTVAGRANIGTGLLHEVYLQVFIQNDSTGLSLFADSFDQPIARGDSIVATGVVQEYFGMTEINVLEYRTYEGKDHRFIPVPLSRIFPKYSAYEGMLVGGTGTVTGKGNRYNGKYIAVAPSDTSSHSIWVYVSNFHSRYEKFDFSSLSPGDRVQIAGILSRYNPGKAKSPIYKIFLRTPEDLEPLGLTQSTLWMLGIAILVILALAATWIISLHSTVRVKTRKLQESLEEKNILLKEIHHRVKNNLAIISGLIELQLDSSLSGEAQKVLRDSQSRIQSMALVHDKLYRTTTVTDIGMHTYIRELVESLKTTFAGPEVDIELRFDIDDIQLDIDKAIPCGLLINELVVNSFKHAFNGHAGVLDVKLKDNGNAYHLVVSDNGRGLPENFREKMQSSLGLMLVETFTDQLDAEMEVQNRDGARFAFDIPVGPQNGSG
ncbi:MAG: histidine kinase dimerization/phosphoacceptor domain -containing protein [Balneolaceae bacterium]|nr:histidine kinase dimerization/phosphoacceptor domain -containing protein [Balneolaceae bacterium]